MAWVPMLTTAASAFLASQVEFVEALTVVLAVGSVRAWRPALAGAGAGVASLLGAVLILGPALRRVPLALLQPLLGGLLLLFGLRWLRKAVLRAAGVIPPHDEADLFARETARLRGLGKVGGWDGVGFWTCCGITLLEGSEVVFIVVALGAGGAARLGAAGLGALAALAAVMAAGIILHRPLAAVPENTLKLLVGVMLSAFGTFWFAEGVFAAWPGGDWAFPGLILVYLALALLLTAACRRRRAGAAAA